MKGRRSWRRLALTLALSVLATGAASGAAVAPDVRRVLDEAGLDAALVARFSDALVRRESVARIGRVPLALVFVLRAHAGDQGQRIMDTTRGAISLLDDWLGPMGVDRLIVVDVPWTSGLSGAAYPGVAMTSSRWWDEPADRALERALIAALARQYWFASARSDTAQGWFAEGLVMYTGTRAVHEWLDGRHGAVVRLFGGLVPRRVPSWQWSIAAVDPRPRVPWFDEFIEPPLAPWRFGATAPEADARRAALALTMIERSIGWPALQVALAEFRATQGEGATGPDRLLAEAGTQLGVDLRQRFGGAFHPGGRIDYGVERFESEPDPSGGPGGYRTVVALHRSGDRGRTDAAPLAITFADGTEVRETWSGHEERVEWTYTGSSRAVSVSVDPDLVLLLDADRGNNTRTLAPHVSSTGVRLAWHWLTWLEDLILTCTAVA